MSQLQPYQQKFIELALEYQVLRFGQFELKSGRLSPYFFNAGLFNTGRALAGLGRCYAEAIIHNQLDYDLLFGPAYKGIPLVAVIAAALSEFYNIDKPYCFNRKEPKVHGEGGQMVGAALEGKALIVDDVITAGTAIQDVLAMVQQTEASVCSVLVGLDREECAGTATEIGSNSAIETLKSVHSLPVYSIIGLKHIRQYVAQQGDQELLAKIDSYQARYGIKA